MKLDNPGDAREAALVATEEQFLPHLEDGDVLLIDKLNSLNRLVQWGDNRPAGHVGVWHGDGIYEATIKHSPDGAVVDGVFHTKWDDLMDLSAGDGRGEVPEVRTVTAVRHRAMTDQHRRTLHESLERVIAGSTRYGFRDAVLLTPFAIERSITKTGDERTRAYLKLSLACARYAKTHVRPRAGREEMFCSQLVYQAYEDAGLSIEIVDPLLDRYLARRTSASARRRGGVGRPPGASDSGVADLLDAYDEFFETEVVHGGEPVIARESIRRPGTTTDADVSSLRLPTPTPARRRSLRPGDMVTPGDFWSSPSFELVAVFHRPAGA